MAFLWADFSCLTNASSPRHASIQNNRHKQRLDQSNQDLWQVSDKDNNGQHLFAWIQWWILYQQGLKGCFFCPIWWAGNWLRWLLFWLCAYLQWEHAASLLVSTDVFVLLPAGRCLPESDHCTVALIDYTESYPALNSRDSESLGGHVCQILSQNHWSLTDHHHGLGS